MQHIIGPGEIISNYQSTNPIKVNFGTKIEAGSPVIYMQYSFNRVDYTVEVLGKDKETAVNNILVRLVTLYDTLLGLDESQSPISGVDPVVRKHREEMRMELSDIIGQKKQANFCCSE